MALFVSQCARMLTGAAIAGSLIAVPVQAETASISVAPSTTALQEATSPSPGAGQQGDPFAIFAPRGAPIKHTIDYSIWTEAMQALVLSMGPSLRKTAGEPPKTFNTRRQFGPVSRYRLEGSMLTFRFFDRDVIESFTEYRRDLEATADKVDIQSLTRNEQLAYWLNLHNVALVEQLSIHWPLRQPRRYEIDGVPLDEAKFITVKGVRLSLRDIREKIVYKHWRDPKVIYGFWRGEIGGPALQKSAFEAKNVSQLLDRSAREFVNSLRGTQKLGSKLHVSTLYAETAEFFFPDLEQDVRKHIANYANGDVQEILNNTTKFEASIREWDIADLSGGVREPAIYSGSGSRVTPAMAQFLAQRERKFELMIRQGVRTGTVTFSNIILPGEDENDGQVE